MRWPNHFYFLFFYIFFFPVRSHTPSALYRCFYFCIRTPDTSDFGVAWYTLSGFPLPLNGGPPFYIFDAWYSSNKVSDVIVSYYVSSCDTHGLPQTSHLASWFLCFVCLCQWLCLTSVAEGWYEYTITVQTASLRWSRSDVVNFCCEEQFFYPEQFFFFVFVNLDKRHFW